MVKNIKLYETVTGATEVEGQAEYITSVIPGVGYIIENQAVMYNEEKLPTARYNSYAGEYPTTAGSSFYTTQQDLDLALELLSSGQTTYFGELVSSSSTQYGYEATYVATKKFRIAIEYQDGDVPSPESTHKRTVNVGEELNVIYSTQDATEPGDYEYSVFISDFDSNSMTTTTYGTYIGCQGGETKIGGWYDQIGQNMF